MRRRRRRRIEGKENCHKLFFFFSKNSERENLEALRENERLKSNLEEKSGFEVGLEIIASKKKKKMERGRDGFFFFRTGPTADLLLFLRITQNDIYYHFISEVKNKEEDINRLQKEKQEQSEDSELKLVRAS